ncbi:MAG TPA: thiolase family protein [Candidatus Binatia bacterium]|nr:thiolase family protein [Candidatus Binatia bacterium]
MAENVVVAGVGMTRFGKFLERGVRSLAEEAVNDALKDAGLESKDVQTAYFANAVSGLITGQEMIRGQVALRNTGLLGIPIFNVENACASAASAFHLAWMAVASGQYDVALAVGAEKLFHEDKTRAFRAIGTAVDLESLQELKKRMAETQSKEPAAKEQKGGENRSFFMDIYAAMTREYMNQSGATAEDFADVAVKNHDHGALNPRAQYRNRCTREEVLASREISAPLTLMMCSPIGDGAAAAILCSDKIAKRMGVRKPVPVRASVLISGRDRKGDEPGAAERSAKRAYEVAGIGPDDIDVIEVHDAAAPAELMVYEDIGFCKRGGGPALLRSGQTKLGGKHVVNPSGGLLAKGHPIGATGIAQIVEICEQLRGVAGERQVSGARVGMTENGGGFLGRDAAAMSVHIFGA